MPEIIINLILKVLGGRQKNYKFLSGRGTAGVLPSGQENASGHPGQRWRQQGGDRSRCEQKLRLFFLSLQ